MSGWRTQLKFKLTFQGTLPAASSASRAGIAPLSRQSLRCRWLTQFYAPLALSLLLQILSSLSSSIPTLERILFWASFPCNCLCLSANLGSVPRLGNSWTQIPWANALDWYGDGGSSFPSTTSSGDESGCQSSYSLTRRTCLYWMEQLNSKAASSSNLLEGSTWSPYSHSSRIEGSSGSCFPGYMALKWLVFL